MINLKTEAFVLPVRIKPELLEVFEHPIIFYLTHHSDKRRILPTFVILDCKKQELQYTVSYLPENIKKIEDHDDQEILNGSLQHNPHCSLKINNEHFLTIVDQARYFYHVDRARNEMILYTANDLASSTGKNIYNICSTAYKDADDADFFYFSAATLRGPADEKELLFYRARLDLSEFELLYTEQRAEGRAPHVTKKIGNCLLNSKFVVANLTNNKTGQVFTGEGPYIRFMYKSLYRSFCALHDKIFKEPLPGDEHAFLTTILHDEDFIVYMQSKGRNLFEICANDEDYSFSVDKGEITLLNLDTKKLEVYRTANCMPAHFEIDDETNTVYISSHNFIMLPKHGYLGPAAIEEFSFTGEKLERKGVFSHPDGYRFTTHRFFKYKGKRYLCTFGQPNRLFFVDADTMEMLYHDDIEEDLLSGQSNINDFLNYTNTESFAIRAIEISSDGQYLFLLSHHFIYFYSFPERKIVQKIRYTSDIPLGENLNLKDFRKLTSHVNYLI